MTPTTRKAKITDAFVKAVSFEPSSPTEKSYKIRDTMMQGFVLRLTAGGAKTFYAERKLNGKRCSFNCGPYPALTVTAAKKMADEKLHLMRQGIDPNIKRIEEKLATAEKQKQLGNTFAEVFRRYQQQHGLYRADSSLTPSTKIDKLSNTQKDLMCVEKRLSNTPLWRTPFHLITTDIITETFRQVKKVIQKRNPNQTGVATINKTYRYCIAAYNKEDERIDYQGRNQFALWLSQTKPEKTNRRNRELVLDTDSGKAWLRNIAEMRKDPRFHRRVMADYILLTLLWGTRKNEANELDMENVFFDRKALVFRNTKNGKDHWLPFGPLVEDILQQRKIDNEAWFAKNPKRKSNWIFPSIKYGKHLTEPRNAVEAVNEKAGVTISLHDLRRTFVGETMSTTKDSLLTKLSVNHSSGTSDITASYFSVQSKLKALRPYFEEWELRLLTLAGIVEKMQDGDGLATIIEKLKLRPELMAQLIQQLDNA